MEWFTFGTREHNDKNGWFLTIPSSVVRWFKYKDTGQGNLVSGLPYLTF